MQPHADARVALLSRLIDHAPLFPPASPALPDAVAEDERARTSRDAFILARFVCPASRLEEIPDVGRGVSAVLDRPLPAKASVEAVEVRMGSEPATLATLAPEVYVEIPVDHGLDERLDAISAHGLRAKVRCAGAEVPTEEALAVFSGQIAMDEIYDGGLCQLVATDPLVWNPVHERTRERAADQRPIGRADVEPARHAEE